MVYFAKIKSYIILHKLVSIIVVLALGALLLAKKPVVPVPENEPVVTESETVGTDIPTAPTAEEAKTNTAENEITAPAVKEFTVIGSSFMYDPAALAVNLGDTVKITFKNSGGMHDWKIDEFGAATKKIKTGEEEVLEFVAGKAGTFEYYCSVGDHRTKGMKGTLTVQ